MKEFSAPIDRTMTENGELFTTEQFCHELTAINFNEEGPRIGVYGVDLDPESMLGSLAAIGALEPVQSSDGLLSHVKENPNALAADNSGSSRYFTLHTDGQYLPVVPEMVVLYCVNPGAKEIPTVFADTEDILTILRSNDLLHEAKSYEHVFINKHGETFVRPLIEINPRNNKPVMNIALASPQCHLRPIKGANATQQDADNYYALLQEIAEQQITMLSHVWQQNDAVVFDNQRLVHGRGLAEDISSNISDVKRHLVRIWLKRIIETTPDE